VQSLADFIYDVSRELLIHAEKLGWDSSTTPATASPSVGVSNAELTRLHGIAKRRVRKRILFFNTEDGLRLRLMATTHQQKQTPLSMYCALCGNNADTEGNSRSFRGHRFSFKCSLCEVHLCVRTYTGLRKSCWDMWHCCVKHAHVSQTLLA
jgi:transposase-like protein